MLKTLRLKNNLNYMIPNGITTEWKKRQPKSKLLNFILSLSIFTSFLIIAIGLPLI